MTISSECYFNIVVRPLAVPLYHLTGLKVHRLVHKGVYGALARNSAGAPRIMCPVTARVYRKTLLHSLQTFSLVN